MHQLYDSLSGPLQEQYFDELKYSRRRNFFFLSGFGTFVYRFRGLHWGLFWDCSTLFFLDFFSTHEESIVIATNYNGKSCTTRWLPGLRGVALCGSLCRKVTGECLGPIADRPRRVSLDEIVCHVDVTETARVNNYTHAAKDAVKNRVEHSRQQIQCFVEIFSVNAELF